MTLLYHGTQIRHLPGIFSSNKVVGYWSDDIMQAMAFSVVMPFADDQLFPPDRSSIILVIDCDKDEMFEASGDPLWLTPIDGFIETTNLIHGLRYDGPLRDINIANRSTWESWKRMKFWKRITIHQMKRFKKVSKSIVDGMLFIEPDPIAVAFREILEDRRTCEFMGKTFSLQSRIDLYELTEINQHDQDNGFDTIVLIDGDIVRQYRSIETSYDEVSPDITFKELLVLERTTRINRFYEVGANERRRHC